MIGTVTDRDHGGRNMVISGLLLLVSGPALNFIFERYNIFAFLEDPAYRVSWLDLLYPPICVFLFLNGIVLTVGAATRRAAGRRLLGYALAIVVPVTLFYVLFSFGMQFIQTGADRLGECPGLDQAASSSNVIPEAEWRPGHSAVSCGVERRGVFLSYYNDLRVYGVADRAAQQRVLDRLAEYRRQANTHPVQVMFYESANWSVRQGQNGPILRSGRPGKLIRLVNIG